MKTYTPFALAVLAACGGPSEQESQQLFAATTTAMASARTRAVAGKTSGTLDFQGPCTLGGSVSVDGSYEAGARATFDLRVAFDMCREPAGTIDGDLHWTATVTDALVDERFTGSIDLDSISCDLDVALVVGTTGVRYNGSVCGYDVHVEVGVP